MVDNTTCPLSFEEFGFTLEHETFAITQWRTEGDGLGGFKPPPRNSEDNGGVLDRMSKKNRRLDFLFQFAVFSYGCDLLNKGFF